MIAAISFAPDVYAFVQGIGVGFLLVGAVLVPAGALAIFRRVAGV